MAYYRSMASSIKAKTKSRLLRVVKRSLLSFCAKPVFATNLFLSLPLENVAF